MAHVAPESTSLAHTRLEHDMNRCGNVYETTNIGGQARVVVGNVYINYLHAKEHPFASPPYYACPRFYTAFSTTTLTKRWWVQYRILPWLLTMTRETISRRSSRATENSSFWRFDCFGKYMVYLGICFEATGDLRLYRPRLRNIVSSDSKLVRACQMGDLSVVRYLLSNRTASPHDVTQDDLSPLFFAINGGHEHIVQELLTYGADANQNFGSYQSSPLAWALQKRNLSIVRLLMQQGGYLRYVSTSGWSVLFYLWTDETDPQPSCLEFLQVLQTADPELFTSLSSHEVTNDSWVLFNRVACTGTPDELNFLIENGADPYFENEFGWNAIFDAVYGGKLGNVQRLAEYFPDFPALRDTRGWTLLHVAAEEGHDDIVRYLLFHGADWQATSWPSCTETGGTVSGITYTPIEAARAQSGEGYAQRFMKIVEQILGPMELHA